MALSHQQWAAFSAIMNSALGDAHNVGKLLMRRPIHVA
jgi:hypothetical protein